jgi:hypothetical protein
MLALLFRRWPLNIERTTMTGAVTHQTDLDQAEIEALLKDDQATDTPTAAKVDELPAVQATKEQPATIEGTETAVDDKPKGDTRAALRASRRAEHRNRQEIERLHAELEEARKATPAQAQVVDGLTDDDVNNLEEMDPAFGRLARQNKLLQSQVTALLGQQGSSQQRQADPEFQPLVLPPELQDVVDDIPDLLEWQHDPDQASFQMATAEDNKLRLHPKWKDKPLAERFAEVARRVKADLGEASPTTSKPRVNVEDALERALRVRPGTLSDIGGSGEIQKSASSLSRFASMSDSDIEAELLSG